ncbi:heavy-metal-associated domain-containing protein [Streptomyces sp. NPDC058092]|uniref:heavy-metal-associated domain-containing protein n=1 Tax=Streptomyces sp. NPDC058092 TaxID=3346336 RepID=UPI0036F0AADE
MQGEVQCLPAIQGRGIHGDTPKGYHHSHSFPGGTMSDCCTPDGSCSTGATQSATAGSFSTVYTVTGMTCDHCKKSVSEAVSGIEGVLSVDVDVEAGRVAVATSAQPEDAVFAKAIDDAGYALTGRAV